MQHSFSTYTYFFLSFSFRQRVGYFAEHIPVSVPMREQRYRPTQREMRGSLDPITLRSDGFALRNRLRVVSAACSFERSVVYLRRLPVRCRGGKSANKNKNNINIYIQFFCKVIHRSRARNAIYVLPNSI